jgi:hypothetical protein
VLVSLSSFSVTRPGSFFLCSLLAVFSIFHLFPDTQRYEFPVSEEIKSLISQIPTLTFTLKNKILYFSIYEIKHQ